jgi:hypothetical protein
MIVKLTYLQFLGTSCLLNSRHAGCNTLNPTNSQEDLGSMRGQEDERLYLKRLLLPYFTFENAIAITLDFEG